MKHESLFPLFSSGQESAGMMSSWGRTPQFGAATPAYGNMTPLPGGGGRTPSYGSMTPSYGGEGKECYK